ncbi:MAG: phosphate transport system regulatory protein PhoU [Planctomycetes bacterium RIFOXYB12_FULL_42_10]|nr:MAG: phosphate transport system regulatory protein PhoU [Planctomycetes bacterium GWA2_39_15]OHC18915.1 MAG: phosphate transport system regulatory protein PhoU [Planctomycetes bacterium RIFOXYB12_FULL_42_10]
MTREAYHKALINLQDEVLEMAGMVANAIKKSVESLQKRDINESKTIITNDSLINKKRFAIEERCISLIATQQPMAVDLRVLTSILSIITDLERMGDHAEGIAKISLLIGDEPLVKPLIDIPRMSDIGLSMLDKCLKAFVNRDVEAARLICNEDDTVDALHDQVYRELLILMIQNPKIIHQATYLTWVSHNLERIADRVTNIAERIVFMVTGKMEEMNVSKY